MQYNCIHIKSDFSQDWKKDVFEQALFDFGFDTILEDAYYIPTELWEAHRDDIEALCAYTPEVKITAVEICEDRNWNAAWEAEHPVQELPKGVKIVPHCAFGAGHHETTAMMIEEILNTDLEGKRVLDNGCGTGVLGIMAAKCGALNVVAVDIDDKSVDNSRENAELNGVEMDIRLGSVPPEGEYDLIMANIHRNILIAQMPLYKAYLADEGELWISGFMEEDCALLQEAALAQGLKMKATRANGEWRMMVFISSIS